MRTDPTLRTVSAQVSSTGAVVAGGGLAASRASTGNYPIRYLGGFDAVYSVNVTPITGSPIWAVVANVGNETCTVLIFHSNTTAIDAGFYITVTGLPRT
jgi:hypothetical protein